MNTESTKKSRGHGFFVLFFTFYIKTMKNHKKAPKSTKKCEKALKSKLGVFLMSHVHLEFLRSYPYCFLF